MYEDVIQQIKQGNLEPLDKIYLEHKAEFIGFARTNYNQLPIETAEDAYQDTLIDVYRNITAGRLTSIEYSFKTYIFHIGRIKLLKAAEQQKKQPTTELSAIENTYEYDATREHNWQEVEKAVEFVFANTSEACKQILKLFYFDKLSMQEIAAKLGYANADTVKAKKNRCINQIAQKAAGLFNLNL